MSSHTERHTSSHTPHIVAAGEDSLLVYFADKPSEAAWQQVHASRQLLDSKTAPWLLQCIPSYTSLLLYYDPLRIGFSAAKEHLTEWLVDSESLNSFQQQWQGRQLELPVYYHTSTGPDLEAVAALHQLTIEELIERHHRQRYKAFALGFAPGFAYLGELDPSIATPRHQKPRKLVPAGSVGIAERQTAIYPMDSPGGWQIIGRCPLTLFSPTLSQPSRIQLGDEIQFVPISRREFLRLGGEL